MNEFVKHSTISNEELETIIKMGPIFHKARLFGIEMIKTPEVSMSIMLIGHSLGLNPIASLGGIYIIENKPSLAPKLMLSLVYASGLLKNISFDPEYKNGNIFKYSVTATRSNLGGEDITKTEWWSMELATKAGLTGKHNWKAYPEQMLKWRCVGWMCDSLFADVVGGMKSSEELGAKIDETGGVIGVEIESTYTEIIRDINSEFQELLVEYGPALVFEKCNNAPPQTEDDLNALIEALKTPEAVE